MIGILGFRVHCETSTQRSHANHDGGRQLTISIEAASIWNLDILTVTPVAQTVVNVRIDGVANNLHRAMAHHKETAAGVRLPKLVSPHFSPLPQSVVFDFR